MENKAYNYILNQILEKVLLLSDTPRQFAQYLTEQIRELVGAKTIVIAVKEGSDQTRILSVFPVRRTDWVMQSPIKDLANITFTYNSVQFLDRHSDHLPVEDILTTIGIDEAIVIPLIAANRRVGSILLLGIMDSYGIESVINLLNQLSGVFALIIRNAYLYHNMEDMVNLRTQELQRRNEEMVLRENQLSITNQAYQVLNKELAENIRKTEEINRNLKEAILRAEKSEMQARDILLTVMDGFLIVDHKGNFLEVNDALCKIYGYSREEMLAKNIADLEAVESPADIATHINNIIKNTEDRFESQHWHKDNKIINVEVSVKYQPELNLMVCFIRDITARKNSELQRDFERREKEALINSTKDLI